ncbi:uncharacterized protein LOC143278052 isoform X2 [Babylonia areolata]|uniref:uncharacterized protein LOC143278052 isoform X2 n=1 Tax=Babylonia areolata TaxID=304850 RepID=UPI003FCF8CEA
MSASHLPSAMIQQSQVSSLYNSDGNYGLHIQGPQTYMAVSPNLTAEQAQVLSGAEGVVGFLPSSHVSQTGDYEPPLTDVGRPGNLGDVYNVLPHTSLPAGVTQDKVITISFQQIPEPDVSTLYQAALESYPTMAIPDPPHTASTITGKGDKPASADKKALFTCDQCPATFRRSSNLKIHLQRHLGNKPFTCDQCPAAFVEEKNLKRHLVAHRTERPHVCVECGLAFVESGNLTRHMLTHSGSKDYMCHTCGAAFSKAHHLKDHLLGHASATDSSRREHSCEECQHVFNNPYQLRKHIKSVHSGGSGRPYSCPQCGAAFGWWNLFRRHLLTHRGQKPFVCDRCEEAFSDNLALRQHKRTHARNKNNACHVCQAAFDRPSHLERHLRVHTGEKPNVCAECGAAFLERNKLARHMRIHEGAVGGAVVCELCGARFSQTRHLTHHMKSHQHTPAPESQVTTTQTDVRGSALGGCKKKSRPARDKSSMPAKRKRRSDKKAVIKYITVSVHTKRRTRADSASSKEDGSFRVEDCKQHVGRDDKAAGKRTREGAGGRRQRGRKSGEQNPGCDDSCTPSHDTEQHLTAGPEDPLHEEPTGRQRRPGTGAGLATHTGRRRKRGRGISISKTRGSAQTFKETDDDKTDEHHAALIPPSTADEATGGQLSLNRSDDDSDEEMMEDSLMTGTMGKEFITPSVEETGEGNDSGDKGENPERGASMQWGEEETGIAVMTTSSVAVRGNTLANLTLDGERDHTEPEQREDSSVDADPPSPPDTAITTDAAATTATAAGNAQPHQEASMAWWPFVTNTPLPTTTPVSAAEQPVESLPSRLQPGDALPGNQQQSGESLPGKQQHEGREESAGFVLYACQQCSAVFNSSFSLKLHKRVHRTRASVCLRCGGVFKGSADLAVHREVCTGFLPLNPRSDLPSAPHQPVSGVHSSDRSSKTTKAHECRLCGASFDLNSKLKLHMQFHTDGRKHVCSECGASFSKSTDLRAHERTHTGDRPFVCGVCGASYTQSSTLSVHMRTHSGVKPHVCKVCGAAFPRHGRLKAHMRCHSGEKPCVCKECGAAFKWAQTLLRHTAAEHGQGAGFPCKLCGQSFPRERQLKAHLQVHSGERPHSCPQCPKAFKKLVQLRRHSRVHTGDWPFLCEECGTGFGSAASLKIHTRCHTGEKPFVCEECGRAFRISSHLRRHIASHTDDPIYVKRQRFGDKHSQSQ